MGIHIFSSWSPKTSKTMKLSLVGRGLATLPAEALEILKYDWKQEVTTKELGKNTLSNNRKIAIIYPWCSTIRSRVIKLYFMISVYISFGKILLNVIPRKLNNTEPIRNIFLSITRINISPWGKYTFFVSRWYRKNC